jgi:hypothetical protein
MLRQNLIRAENGACVTPCCKSRCSEMCQNCVKTLSVLAIGVSFRAKSRCPKLL